MEARFGVAVWKLWEWRNQFVFSPQQPLNYDKLYAITSYTRVLTTSASILEERRLQPRLQSNICWAAPPPGVIKINTDGAFHPATQRAFAGGLIRIHRDIG